MPKPLRSRTRPRWQVWFESLTAVEQQTIGRAAIEHLLDLGEVKHRKADPEEPELPECLYWDTTGEDLRDV